jgi:hypothetical protein
MKQAVQEAMASTGLYEMALSVMLPLSFVIFSKDHRIEASQIECPWTSAGIFYDVTTRVALASVSLDHLQELLLFLPFLILVASLISVK